MKRGILISTLLLGTSASLFAAAYKIPEQSLNSMALGAAYVAHTEGADTAYFNPAAMAFMDQKRYVEGGATLAHLPAIDYTLTDPYSGESKVENIAIPYLHYVGNAIGKWRWGLAVAAPAGLSKRWETPYQKAFAQEFTLKNVELNPVFSYKFSDRFAVGGGVRLIYSQGKVYSDGNDAGIPLKREMKGDTFAAGYNLALLFKPTNDINLAATYRSKVTLNEKGKANLYFGGAGKQYDASVSIPIPAALNLAISKTWDDRFTLEFDYERTFWSAYKQLDFKYEQPILNPILRQAFDDPLQRQWKDTNTYRIGATVKMDNKLTAMFGFAIDQTPINEKYIGFELPDSDAKIFTMGFRYRANEKLSWGAAFLYDSKKPRSLSQGTVVNNPVLSYGGSFEGGGAMLFTVGVSYEY